MKKTTCDDCGSDITVEPHWELVYVVPSGSGASAVSETRNTFCTDCW